MAFSVSCRCAGFVRTCLVAAVGTLFSGLLWAQAPTKSYLECNHDSLIRVFRAYEDSLALASSASVVRVDYAWHVTDVAVAGKVYKIYRCEALYDSLEVLMDAVAFARMTPPSVDTDSIGSISGTGATFYGKVTSDGDTAVTAQWFRYGLSAGSLSDSLAVSGVATPFSAVASGLANGMTYYVAGFARNAKGTTPGDTLSFTTWAAPTVDTQAASSISATAATLNATFTNGGNAVTATGFKYATNAALTGATSVAGSGTSSPFTKALTGLTHATQYWAVGYATNAVGTSYGDTITFTTSAIAPTVDTDAASSVTSSAATLNATITATGGAAVSATGFKYATNSALTGATSVAGSGTSSPFTKALTGLTHATQYWAVGYATNSVGTSYGDTITFTTSALAPTVDTQAASSISATAATLNATFTNGGNVVTATGFKYATNSALTGATSVAGSGTSSPFTGSLTGLTHATQYWAVGYATNSVGTSYGDTITFTTSAIAPTVDTDAASSVTATAATLNATITATGGAAVSATGFKYATNSALTGATSVAGSGTSSPFTASLTGLTASTQYWTVGYATNSVGTSYGDTITFTTSTSAPAAPAAFTCGTSTVTYDGHNYTTVLIGSQCWFQENLRNDSYNDGTSIAGNLNNSAWTTTTSGAQAIYGGDSLNNYAVYGRLYNGYAVNTGKLCPTGWHVPTDTEWDDLETYLGGDGAAVKLKVSSTHTPAWNGNNSSGFTALPGGGRNQGTGLYTLITDRGNWWSSTSSPTGNWNRYWSTSNSTPIRFDATLRFGFSVRCIQD